MTQTTDAALVERKEPHIFRQFIGHALFQLAQRINPKLLDDLVEDVLAAEATVKAPTP